MLARSEPLAVVRAVRRLRRPFRELGSELLVPFAWAALLTGREAELRTVLAVLDERRRQGSLEGELLTQLFNIQAGIARQRGDLDGAILATEQALAQASHDPLELRAGLALYLAVAQFFRGDVGPAGRSARLGVECFSHEEPLPLVGISCLSVLSQARAAQGRLDEAEEVCRQAFVDLEREGSPATAAALIHRSRGRIQLERGQWDEATRSFDRAEEISRAAGFHELSTLIALWSAETARIVGARARLDRNLRHLDSVAIRDRLTAGVEHWHAALKILHALDQGDDDTADHEVHRVRHLVSGTASLLDEKLRCATARWARRRGDLPRATELLDGALTSARRQGRRESEIELLAWQARLEARQGRHQRAGEILRRALALATAGAQVRPFAIDPELVRDLLTTQATASPQRSDVRKFTDRLRRVLAELVQRRADARLKDSPTTDKSGEPTLTPRELEVLRLVAEGCSNQQIATRLFVSLSTVKTHLHHIFQKLDVGRRTQALSRARELGQI